jgi:primosomal protein N' (replication factor Y)
MIKSARGFDLSAYMRAWLADAPKRVGDIKLEVDVDPLSFL